MTPPEKITCKDASVLLSQSQDRPMTPAETLRLQAHIAVCKACEAFQRQLEFLRGALRRRATRNDEDDPQP